MILNTLKTVNDMSVGDYVKIADEFSRPMKTNVVYRVIRITREGREYVIEPVFGLFDSHKKRGIIYVHSSEIERVDIMSLGSEFSKFTDLIRQAAQHYGCVTPGDTQINQEPQDSGNPSVDHD